MTGYVNAARVAAVVALFALPPLLLTVDAAAADRRYGSAKPPSTGTNPQRVYVNPNPAPVPKDWGKSVCGMFRSSRPLEYKECMARQR